jgi:hypothetical protein
VAGSKSGLRNHGGASAWTMIEPRGVGRTAAQQAPACAGAGGSPLLVL